MCIRDRGWRLPVPGYPKLKSISSKRADSFGYSGGNASVKNVNITGGTLYFGDVYKRQVYARVLADFFNVRARDK